MTTQNTTGYIIRKGNKVFDCFSRWTDGPAFVFNTFADAEKAMARRAETPLSSFARPNVTYEIVEA